MGLILGRFRRKKTTLEQLEKLDADIKSIETFRLNTELAQRRIVGQFILVSAGIYIIVAIVFYFNFFPATFYDQIFYITPLLLVPFIIWGVKRLLTWYYRRKISRNENKLSGLRTEKKKLLDHVMDTETYKVAKTILEKFAPEQTRKSPVSFNVTPYKPTLKSIENTGAVLSTPATVRNRGLVPKAAGEGSLFGAPKTPGAPISYTGRGMSTPFPQGPNRGANGQHETTVMTVRTQQQGRMTPMPTPREILPRERSILDKMVEYLVGDGPGNRYALICKSCHAHNGMALPEEFEYFAFRCCYCYTFNPARKLRPQAPKLELEASSSPERKRRDSMNSTSSSEKNSGTDTETEEKELKRHVLGSLSSARPDTETEEKELKRHVLGSLSGVRPDSGIVDPTVRSRSPSVQDMEVDETPEKTEEDKKLD